MGAAIQLYAGFALLVIAIIAIIVIAALVSNLIRAVRQLFGRARRVEKTRAPDDFSAPTRPSRPAPGTSRPATRASRSGNPPASR